MLGQRASSVLEGDRVVSIRVRVDGASIGDVASLRELPLRIKENEFGTIRGRAGMLVKPTLLAYVTGGFLGPDSGGHDFRFPVAL
jgi:hypothetical protein